MNIFERSNDKVIPLRTTIHPTAVVHPQAQLGVGVKVGPFSIIGENVTVGDNTEIGAHVVLEGWTTIGKRNQIFTGAVVGSEPQDLKFKGEKSYLFIGDDNKIREYSTISRGTEGGGGETRLGNNNLIMTSVHIAHDVQIGNHCVVAHGSGVAGHVIIEDYVTIGGICGVHQFVKIGRMAMTGAHSMVTQDVPPYMLVQGNPARVHGVNIVRLRRAGFTPEMRQEIKRAFKLLYMSKLNVTQAVERMEQELPGFEEIDHLLRFIKGAERGICRMAREARESS